MWYMNFKKLRILTAEEPDDEFAGFDKYQSQGKERNRGFYQSPP